MGIFDNLEHPGLTEMIPLKIAHDFLILSDEELISYINQDNNLKEIGEVSSNDITRGHIPKNKRIMVANAFLGNVFRKVAKIFNVKDKNLAIECFK